MEQSVHLGRWRGIEIGANWSVLLIAGLLTWLLAASVLPAAAPGRLTIAYWATGVVAAALFFASLLAHEMSHALVARRHGVEVKQITLWLLGGVAKMESQSQDADTELRIGIVGPLTSIAIGVVAGALAALGGLSDSLTLTAAALWWLALINLVIGVFNLLPAFPLDGGRVLRAALWRRWGDQVRATMAAARIGRGFGYGLLAAGFVLFVGGLFLDGIWFALIGWFLVGASTAEAAVTTERILLAGVTAADLMSPDPMVVPAATSVTDLLDQYVLRSRHSSYPVVEVDGSVVGLITLDRVRAVPSEARSTTPVRSAAHPMSEVAVLDPSAPATEVAAALTRPGPGRALVIENGRLVGIVSLSDLSRAVQTRLLIPPGDRPPEAAGSTSSTHEVKG
ncbi:MAG TPA: site-2 protease family protein [Acidimicrobiales bacterium]|nr:site-2 protease family protein [Acidimicrobiales bacterium]